MLLDWAGGMFKKKLEVLRVCGIRKEKRGPLGEVRVMKSEAILGNVLPGLHGRC